MPPALTQKALPTLPDGVYEDDQARMLVYRVAKGVGTFLVVYTTREGFKRKLRIGAPPTMDLPTARRIAAKIQADVVIGRDPYAELINKPTMGALLDKFQEPGNQDLVDTLKDSLGHIPVEDLLVRHVEALRDTKVGVVAKSLSLLRRALAHAEKIGWRSPGTNPVVELADTVDPNMTVAELLDRYLLRKVEGVLAVEDVTQARAVVATVLTPTLGPMLVKHLSPEHVASLHADVQLNTKLAIDLLSKACTYAERLGLRSKGSNPCRGHRHPSKTRAIS